MKIDNKTTSTAVKEAFIAAFPYLKLEFYINSHDHFHGSMKKDEVIDEKTLEELNPSLNSGMLKWEGTMTVDDFETHLEENFGLHVQVFRKSGDQWLQTSVTDHWTLEKQNSNALEHEKYVTR